MKFFSSLFTFFMMSSLAIAQDAGLAQTLDRLERDLQILQRDVYRGGASAEPGVVSNAPFQANLVVRLGEMETQLTELRGMVEEARHNNDLLKQRIEALEQGLVPRILALEQMQTVEPPVIGDSSKQEAVKAAEPARVAAQKSAPSASPPKVEAPEVEQVIESGVVPTFSSPRKHYNHAFNLLQEEKYAAAEKSFQSFIATYHDDPLLGNVYYWLGETYYVRDQYKEAANEFRKGFQAASEGPKAPDNLLKLGLSLDRLEKKKEACVVLGQLEKKFGKQNSAALKKGKQARDRLNCQ